MFDLDSSLPSEDRTQSNHSNVESDSLWRYQSLLERCNVGWKRIHHRLLLGAGGGGVEAEEERRYSDGSWFRRHPLAALQTHYPKNIEDQCWGISPQEQTTRYTAVLDTAIQLELVPVSHQSFRIEGRAGEMVKMLFVSKRRIHLAAKFSEGETFVRCLTFADDPSVPHFYEVLLRLRHQLSEKQQLKIFAGPFHTFDISSSPLLSCAIAYEINVRGHCHREALSLGFPIVRTHQRRFYLASPLVGTLSKSDAIRRPLTVRLKLDTSIHHVKFCGGWFLPDGDNKPGEWVWRTVHWKG